MSLTAVEPEAPAEPDNHEGCLICTTSRTPNRAYRPHTLDEDCWCTRNEKGVRAIEVCWLVKAYLTQSLAPDEQEA